MNKYDAKSVIKAIEDKGWKVTWQFLELPFGEFDSKTIPKQIYVVIIDDGGFICGDICNWKNNVIDSIDNWVHAPSPSVYFLERCLGNSWWENYQTESND